MCLAIPAQVVEVPKEKLQFGFVQVSGIRRKVVFDMLPEMPNIGDWVLIHVGFAMDTISEEEAQHQLKLIAMVEESLEEEFATEVPDEVAESPSVASTQLATEDIP